MSRFHVPPAMMAEIKEMMISTSEKVLRFRSANTKCTVNCRPLTQTTQSRGSAGRCNCRKLAIVPYPGPSLTYPPQVQELYEVLRIATRRVANVLNEGTPTYRLPPEILTKILYLAVDHDSEEHAEQIIPLTHVCRYWRTLLLSYPRMWSTLRMKPGNPSLISEWLARSQNLPLTVIAEFTDTFEHPQCRYQDSATATLADTDGPGVCLRHKAVLSLNQLLPHHSRIHDLNVFLRSSDPYWDDHSLIEPQLLYHKFFRKALPNLQRLDFRATHIEQTRYVIPIPDFLFVGELPRLEELKYLGVAGGLIVTAKNLVSCEIGFWSGSAGPNSIAPDVLQTFFINNKTLNSLTIGEFGFFLKSDLWVHTTIPMTDLKYLEIHCPFDEDLEKVVKCIHTPRFENLDTAHLSLDYSNNIQVEATDGSGRTFKFSKPINHFRFNPLRYLGAVITTLRLDQGITLYRLDNELALYDFFRSFDAVQVLEFNGTTASALSNVLPATGVFPRLKVIRVALSWDECDEVLELLATPLRLRMEEGNPLTAIEPLPVEDEDGSGPKFSVEWEKYYKAEGIENLLSK